MVPHGAAAEESLSELCVGERVLVKYARDPVWHERVLLWPLSLKRWVICTPDGDVYDELLSGGDVQSWRKLGSRGALPPDLRGQCYRFRAAMRDGTLNANMVVAKKEAQRLCRGPVAGVPVHAGDPGA